MSLQVDSRVGATMAVAGTVDLGNIGPAATAAKQPNFGVVGTPSVDVLTTQFKAGGVAFVVEGKVGGVPVPMDISASAIQGGTLGAAPPTGANNVIVGVLDSSGNVARISLNAAGQLPVGSADGPVVTPASLTSAGDFVTIDTNGYESIVVQVLQAGTTGVIQYKASLDGTTYASASGVPANYGGGTDSTQSSTTTGLWKFLTPGKFFRITLASIVSGTAQVAYQLVQSGAMPPGVVGVQGRSTSGTTIAGAPVAMGFDARTSDLLVTNGQAVYGVSTLNGVQIVRPWSLPELSWNYAAAAGGIVNTTTAVTIKAAGSAGVRNYLKTIDVAADALGSATEFVVRDGAAGAVLWRTKLHLAAMQVMQIPFDPPLRGTAATLMEIATLTATTTGGVFVNATGFQAA